MPNGFKTSYCTLYHHFYNALCFGWYPIHYFRRMCGPNDKVVSLQWREEVGKGLSELYMDCGDGDGEASFTGNPNGIRQELKKECSQGFSSIRGRTAWRQGIVEVSMLCNGETEPNNLRGKKWAPRQHCPPGTRITGIEVLHNAQKGVRNFRLYCSAAWGIPVNSKWTVRESQLYNTCTTLNNNFTHEFEVCAMNNCIVYIFSKLRQLNIRWLPTKNFCMAYCNQTKHWTISTNT